MRIKRVIILVTLRTSSRSSNNQLTTAMQRVNDRDGPPAQTYNIQLYLTEMVRYQPEEPEQQTSLTIMCF